MALTHAQRVSLALTPKFTGLLSTLGSLLIVLDVIGERQKRQNFYHRMMLMFGCVDCLVSFGYFASTWPIPEGTADVIWARGNDRTCAAQGFFLQFGTASFMYNAVLTVYYVLTIRYSVREPVIRKWEKLFHFVPLGFGLGTSTVAAALGWYGNSNLWCWIAGFDNAPVYRVAFYYGPLWLCFLVVLAGMIFIYLKVYSRDRETAKFDAVSRHRRSIFEQKLREKSLSRRETIMVRHEEQSFRRAQNARSRLVARQALFYVTVFYMTYFFATVNRLYQHVTGESRYSLLLLQVIFLPLQGLFNFIVYRRQHVARLRHNNPTWSWKKLFLKALQVSAFRRDPRQLNRRSSIHFSCTRISSSLRHLTQLDDSSSRQPPQEQEDDMQDQPRPDEATGQIEDPMYAPELEHNNEEEPESQLSQCPQDEETDVDLEDQPCRETGRSIEGPMSNSACLEHDNEESQPPGRSDDSECFVEQSVDDKV